MEFGRPELLWLLLLAPAVGLLAHLAWRKRLAAMTAWAGRGLWNRLLPGFDRRLLILQAVLFALAAAGVAATLAQPRWGASEQQVERQGVDIVFVLDTSLSMATPDVQPSRLWVAQTLIRRLVNDLPGHRVALVQAEGDGVVLIPLTDDTAVIDLLLDAVLPGSLPTPGTEIAPALDRARELFPAEGSKHHVMILLSDGEDHGSALEEAVDALEEAGVVAHAIGVGTREGQPLELPFAAQENQGRGDAGGEVEYKRDETGKIVVSRLVESTLEEISRATDGVYVRATSAAADLSPVVGRIEEMEKRTYGSEVVSTLEERFQWPLALAVGALLLQLTAAPFHRVEHGSTESSRGERRS